MPTNTAEEGTRRRPSGPSHDGELVAEIIGSDRGAECTIYPVDAEGMDLMTRWITAGEGSFVSLEDVK